jgi:tetratricopeptide (TPR) repeat protein
MHSGIPEGPPRAHDKDIMNFLIHLLGRIQRADAGIRTAPRDRLLARAAANVARGDFPGALADYRQLTRVARLTPLDLLTRGHLHLVSGHDAAARRDFSRSAHRILAGGSLRRLPDLAPQSGGSIGCLLSKADNSLRRGRYAQAAGFLQDACGLLDALLAAQAGLSIARPSSTDAQTRENVDRASGEPVLVPLARLSDILLRLLARTSLAAHLADSLRKRHLRDDLATWATTTRSVDALLESEYRRLEEVSRSMPDRAESHYRLGLIARVTGRLEPAFKAFSRTLALHPHHVASAARLAATEFQLRMSGGHGASAIAGAFRIPPETLLTFGAFARAASDPGPFDMAVERLCRSIPDDFALSELAILDPLRAAWREAIPA